MLSTRISNLLQKIKNKKTLFIGLGNEKRGDDGIAIYLTKKLKDCKKKINFLLAYTTPENYLQKIIDINPEIIVFMDAVHDEKPEGEISLLKKDEISTAAISTHTTSINLIIQFLEKSCGADIYVIAVSIKRAEFKEQISPKIRDVADELIKELTN